MGKKIIIWISTFVFIFAMGCGQDLPFEYRYISANLVQIKYMDSVYELNRYGTKTDGPFEYQFEPDGDLDIIIAGKTYEIDSPYDIKKTKVKKKKTTTSKKKKKKKR